MRSSSISSSQTCRYNHSKGYLIPEKYACNMTIYTKKIYGSSISAKLLVNISSSMYECCNLFSGMVAYACNKCHLVTEIPTIQQLTNITASFPKRSLCHTKRCFRFAVHLPSILSHPIELTNWEILLSYMY